MDTISIIITSYRRLDFIKNLLDSLKRNTHYVSYEVIVVNSDPGYNEYKDDYLTRKNALKEIILVSDEPKQYMEANESAFVVSTGNYILLLNDDALIPSTENMWLDILHDYLKDHDDVQCLSPYQFMARGVLYTKGELDINKPGRTNGTRSNLKDLPYELETVWNPFSCALFRRSFILENRFLDVVPEPQYHYGSDSCYCRTILDKGFKNVTINSTWIYHFNNRVMNRQVERYTYNES